MRLIAAILGVIVSFNLVQAADAIPGQNSTQSKTISKAKKLILQLQSWNLEDESPPEGQFRALQKQVSSTVKQLFQQGRLKDAKILAAWNKAVSSKHFSKESIPYLAAVSDMVVASANQKDHKAQLSEFDAVFKKMKGTDKLKEAEAIKTEQASVLVVKPISSNGKRATKPSTSRVPTNMTKEQFLKQLEINRLQAERSKAVNDRLRNR